MLCIKHISVALREASDSGAPLRRERGVVRRANGVSAHSFLVGVAVVMGVSMGYCGLGRNEGFGEHI